jgi:putative transposase
MGMLEYRRYRVMGGTYFFTFNLLVRHVALLREVVRKVRANRPFHSDAWVVLPDHLHCVWTLPPGDDDFSTRWRLIKQGFSKALPLTERRSAVRVARGEREIWQRRYWEHVIRNDSDYAAHVDYVHWNPMKHGLVQRVADWPDSTFHRYVKQGRYPPDWAGRLDQGEAGKCDPPCPPARVGWNDEGTPTTTMPVSLGYVPG